ncbi:putative Fe-S cluster assembly protein SufT [Neptunomonas qingdaonensis]|uniref:Probable FeS assembly SUF system protein SufT n=1 Tax=Neptunomonas qingdaonensis TaxID=1045558 RepID=A0A1I2W8Q7_9GAMM|nr:putative Fe-S cluster assembly protein SufT [Neptunomonas qingdaonensis]SFG96436.1 probable FeS assembly SUF system protein SufT [Neptunomonas qingdaonensis]
MSDRQIVTTVMDCPGRLVPVGDPLIIPANTFLTVTQALGGNYTVVYNGNMVRIDGTDAAAIGKEPVQLYFEAPLDGLISKEQVWEALQTIYDPEIPVDLVRLGLIYALDINDDIGEVSIQMTLTAPGCGMGPILMGDVEYRVSQVPHVKKVRVELVFDPPWSRERMSEEALLETGLVW